MNSENRAVTCINAEIEQEKPPYDDPFHNVDDEFPPGPIYPHRYLPEILDMRNWLLSHCRHDFDPHGADASELYDMMKQAQYFTRERAWMADMNHFMIVQELISFACRFKGSIVTPHTGPFPENRNVPSGP